MYALFEGKTQIAGTFATEKEVWEAALIEGLVTSIPSVDELNGQVDPAGYRVERVGETYDPQPDWNAGA